MKIIPIRNKATYERALKRIEILMDADRGSAAFDELEVLSLLVHDYEAKNEPIPQPSPRAAILFAMERKGLHQKDLIPAIGRRNRVSEILSGKRNLTIEMIRKLRPLLGLSADVLIPREA